jgi:hypothetical protein
MARPADDDRTLTWANGQPSENLIILTRKAIYVASVKPKLLSEVDLALEEGEAPEEALKGTYLKVALSRLLRFQYKRSEAVPNPNLTLVYDDGTKERKKTITLGQAQSRDAFVEQLVRRVGWEPIEEDESRAIVLLKYVGILFLVTAGTAFICFAELAGWIDSGPAPLVLCLDFCGVWGVLAVGALIFLGVTAVGINELIKPAVIVSYEPDENEDE